jgi:hypothetical protein
VVGKDDCETLCCIAEQLRIWQRGNSFFRSRKRFAMVFDARFAALAVGFGLVLSALPVQADDTGLAGLHSWRKVGGKTCFVDHSHEGSGNGSSQKAAEMAAIRSWIGFTDLEYGSDWANFRNAVAKTMKCNREGGAFWKCSTEAVPCRGR